MVVAHDHQLILVDGPNARVLATTKDPDAHITYPRWSPDGSRVAFVQASLLLRLEGDWGDDIFVVDPDTGEQRVLRPHLRAGEQISGMDWTPDGERIVVGIRQVRVSDSRIEGFDLRIEEYDPETDASRLLVDGATEPSVSRNGRLAYLAVTSDGSRLLVSALDGSGAVELEAARGAAFIFAPRIAPDGDAVAFAAPAVAFMSTPRQPSRVVGVFGWFERVARLGARSAEAHGVPMDVWRVSTDGSPGAVTPMAEDDPRIAWASNDTLLAVATGYTYAIDAGGQATPIAAGYFDGSVDVAPND
ncbi:MAG: hypothetical protein R3C39_12455 [Dehalococcoidia bacterium]